ncbi:UNVERIFIED_CONTAM: hypothetical protein FKN15_042064 [Acipenser sinensis]
MNCKELLEQGNTLSDWYTVYTASKKPISVFCDMHTDGGGWLVFQRRMDGSVDFFRDWNSYKRGFGNKQTEFWLGNENIHLLTATAQAYARVIDLNGEPNEGYYTAGSSVFWRGATPLTNQNPGMDTTTREL